MLLLLLACYVTVCLGKKLLVLLLLACHLRELVMRHLHQFPLVLYLAMRYIKGLISNLIARCHHHATIIQPIRVHYMALLGLLVLEVGAGRGRLP